VFLKKKSPQKEISEIVAGCKANSQSAQRKLFEIFSRKAMGICSKYAASEYEAEEMMMDGFLKIYRNIGQYNDQYDFGGWFHRIMVNASIDYFRKHHSRLEFVEIKEAETSAFDDSKIDLLSVDEILEFVRKLSPVYRAVFSLHVIDGYNFKEIGEMLHIAESAVRSNLSKAKHRLQGWIEEYISQQEKI